MEDTHMITPEIRDKPLIWYKYVLCGSTKSPKTSIKLGKTEEVQSRPRENWEAGIRMILSLIHI